MSVIAGIDLGTTYSALAALNAIGKPEIVPDLNGNRVVPSIVAFSSSDSVLVGTEAKNKLSSDPTHVIQFVKRKMNDPAHRYSVHDTEYSPIEISALILKKLKDECIQLGDIKDVVITVPAHFNEVERKSTMDAGKIAGLNVLGIVNEPTAAALYSASLTAINGKVMIYDLGGGTFDVTIIDMDGDKMDVLASKGDGHLGGVDFDNRLTQHLIENAREELSHELVPDEYFSDLPAENCEELNSYFMFMDRAEQLKKQLSARDNARGMLVTQQGNVRLSALRSDFEEMISPFIVTTEMLIENALEDAGLAAADIKKVILVGGSTRIPKVVKTLEAFFGFAPEQTVNPDEAVALGAAIMAGKRKLQSGDSKGVSAAIRAEVAKTNVVECANKYFGTLSVSYSDARGEHKLLNSVIIHRGMKLPCEETGHFSTISDGQKEIEIKVTECDEEIIDPEHVHNIGKWSIQLPANCPKGSPVTITYGYSEDQRLKVTVELPDGKSFVADLHYDSQGNLDQSEMEQASAKLNAFLVE
jgi:molecular chaperone DnaK